MVASTYYDVGTVRSVAITAARASAVVHAALAITTAQPACVYSTLGPFGLGVLKFNSLMFSRMHGVLNVN
jgi:hypothetical protein